MRITAANNPFRVEERWQEAGHRASIIGPHGVGKTTLLESWQKRLEGKGEQVLRIFLNRQERWLETRHHQAGFPVIADLQPNRALLDRCLLALGEEVPKELLNDWWESHHGNLREVLLCCYDWKAKRVG